MEQSIKDTLKEFCKAVEEDGHEISYWPFGSNDIAEYFLIGESIAKIGEKDEGQRQYYMGITHVKSPDTGKHMVFTDNGLSYCPKCRKPVRLITGVKNKGLHKEYCESCKDSA